MAGSVRIVGKVRFVYARCDADASYLAYTLRFCRPDKQSASGIQRLMRRWRVLSGLRAAIL